MNEKLLPLVSKCNKNIIADVCKKFNENVFLPEKDVFVKQYLNSHDESFYRHKKTTCENRHGKKEN